MSKPIFGDNSRKRQKELCLEYAAELRATQRAPTTPTEITNFCFSRGLFTDAQQEFWRFEGARRWVERCLKTRDETGLEMWAQLPLTDESGELFWEKRLDMTVTGYAWNYLLRDDLVERNTGRREKWRGEAEDRFGSARFNAEVARLRLEREGRGAA